MPRLPLACIIASALVLLGCKSLLDPFGTSVEPKLPGQRLVILSENSRLTLDSALQNIPFLLPKATSVAEWPMQRANGRHFLENLSWGGSWQPLWRSDIGGTYSSEHPLQAPPVIATDRVFALDNDYTVTAVNITDGAKIWQFDNTTDIEFTTTYGGGLALNQGSLVITTGYGDVIALDPLSGEEKWRVSLRIPIRGSATIFQNQAVVQTLDNQAFAFDLSDGTEVWYHAGINEITSVINQTAPASDETRVFIAYNSGEIAAIDPNSGEPLWLDTLDSLQRTSELAQINTIGPSPIVINDTLLVSGYSDHMVLFNVSTGQRIWELEIGTLQLPWVSGNMFFVLGNDQRLYALDLFSGKLRWIVQPDEALHLYQKAQEPQNEEDAEMTSEDIVAEGFTRQHWGASVMVDDHLLMLSEEGTLLKLDPGNGAIVASRKFESGSRLPIQIVGSTALVIGTNGVISAYR